MYMRFYFLLLLVVLLASPSHVLAGPIVDHLDFCYYHLKKVVADTESTISELKDEQVKNEKKGTAILSEFNEIYKTLKRKFPDVRLGEQSTYVPDANDLIARAQELAREKYYNDKKHWYTSRRIDFIERELESLKPSVDLYYKSPRTRPEMESYKKEKQAEYNQLMSKDNVRLRAQQNKDYEYFMKQIIDVNERGKYPSSSPNEMVSSSLDNPDYKCPSDSFFVIFDVKSNEFKKIDERCSQWRLAQHSINKFSYSLVEPNLDIALPEEKDIDDQIRFLTSRAQLNNPSQEKLPDDYKVEMEAKWKKIFELEASIIPLMQDRSAFLEKKDHLEKELKMIDTLLSIDAKSIESHTEKKKCFTYDDRNYTGFIDSLISVDEVLKRKTNPAFSNQCEPAGAAPADDRVGSYKVSKKEYEDRRRQERRERELKMRWSPGWEKK